MAANLRKAMILRHIAFLLGGVVASASQGGALVESYDRVEINWSTMKIRYFGEAKADADYKEAERAAWQEGLGYLHQAIPKLKEEAFGAAGDQAAGGDLATSTRSYNTTYFADGHIRVHLENDLARAFKAANIQFAKDRPSSGETKNTGVVLRVKGKAKPTPLYQVVSDQGKALYRPENVARSAFESKLMGRWYHKAGAGELAAAVGANPVELVAEPGPDGTLKVDQALWREAVAGNEPLLEAAKVAIVVE